MNNLSKYLRFTVVFSCILYMSCITDDDDNRGTEVENEILGKIVHTDGSPAVGAKVRIYPVEYNPAPLSGSKAPDTAITNAKGEYTVNVPTGSYNILASSNNLFAYSDSVNISDKLKSLPTDTLTKSGSITGYVALQPIHLPTNATVELIGTNYFSNVDLSGKFYFPSLATGSYTVRISVDSKLPYSPLYSSFSVESGNAHILSDTLRPQYNGIPVVRNIKAVYDSVQGIVRINWDPIQYSLLRDYQIYRDPSNYITLSNESIGRSKTTTYIDTIYKNGVSNIDLDQSDLEFEYRVVARNLSNDSSSTFERATVKILPLTSLTTQFKTSILSFFDEPNNTVLAGDTLKIVTDYHNDTRILDSIIWQMQGSTKPLRTVSLNAKNGFDTLVYFLPLLGSPQTESSLVINVKIKDKQGEWWNADPIRLNVYDDRPILDAGKDTIVARDTTYTLYANVKMRYGKVDKWEWDIGGTGKFIETSGPDTTIRTPSKGMFGYKCVVKGVYLKGILFDTVSLNISNSKYLKRIPTYGNAVLFFDDSLYLFDQYGITIIDTNNIYSHRLNFPINYTPIPIIFNNKFYIFGYPYNVPKNKYKPDSAIILTYDSRTKLWDSIYTPIIHTATVLKGKLIGFTNDTMFTYIDSSKMWVKSYFKSPLTRAIWKVIEFEGKLIFSRNTEIFELDVQTDQWTSISDIVPDPNGILPFYYIFETNSKLYLVRGHIGGTQLSDCFVFDSTTNRWKILQNSDIDRNLNNNFHFFYNSKIYFGKDQSYSIEYKIPE